MGLRNPAVGAAQGIPGGCGDVVHVDSLDTFGDDSLHHMKAHFRDIKSQTVNNTYEHYYEQIKVVRYVYVLTLSMSMHRYCVVGKKL